MTLSATVSHTINTDEYGRKTFHYVVNLSNGISFKRQAKGGAQGVAFSLNQPGVRQFKTTASKNIKRLISKYRNQVGFVIVNLETEEVIICA